MKKSQIFKLLFSFLLIISVAVAIPVSVYAKTKVQTPSITVKTNGENPKISWKKIDGVTGYKVFRKTSTDKKWVKVTTTSKTSVTDKKWDAAEGSQISYMVKAYVKKDGKTTWSSASKTKKWSVPEIKMSAEEVYENCSESVVMIEAELPRNMISQGSGFFIDSHTIVTNYHVIDSAYAIYIIPKEGEKYKVSKVLGYDSQLDIAVLKVSKYTGEPLNLNTHGVKVGETVYALGNPIGLTDTFSNGIVTTASRKSNGQDLIQINVDITNGSSGGALINSFGEVIGITSSGYDGTLLNFAINIDQLQLVDLSKPMTVEEFYGSADAESLLIDMIMNNNPEYDSRNDQYYLYYRSPRGRVEYCIIYSQASGEIFFERVTSNSDVISLFSGDENYLIGGYYYYSSYNIADYSMFASVNAAKYTGKVSQLEIEDTETTPDDLTDAMLDMINTAFSDYLGWLESVFEVYEPRLSLEKIGFSSFKAS